MSGRLITSKHKGYHPWNQKNIERVERDERLDRERKAEEECERREEQQKDVFKKLKGDNTNDNEVDDDENDAGSNGEEKRFSLFRDEERQAANKIVGATETTKHKPNFTNKEVSF